MSRFRYPRRRSRLFTLLAAGAAAAAVYPVATDLLAPAPAADSASGVHERAERDPALSGRPSWVTDGDTFRFGEVRVRLHGINAPEMDTADGPRAREALRAVIGGGQVVCEDTGQRSYDRIVARCFDAQGRDLAEQMVRKGWAADWPRFSGGRYAASEAAAVAQGRGVHRR